MIFGGSSGWRRVPKTSLAGSRRGLSVTEFCQTDVYCVSMASPRPPESACVRREPGTVFPGTTKSTRLFYAESWLSWIWAEDDPAAMRWRSSQGGPAGATEEREIGRNGQRQMLM